MVYHHSAMEASSPPNTTPTPDAPLQHAPRRIEDENSVVLRGRLASVREIPLHDPERQGVDLVLEVTNGRDEPERFALTAWNDVARQVSALPLGSRIQLAGKLRRARYGERKAMVAISDVKLVQ